MGYSPWSPKSRTQLSNQTTTMCVLRSACVSFALAVAGLLCCRLSLVAGGHPLPHTAQASRRGGSS